MSADNRHRTTNARALPRKKANDDVYTTPSTDTNRTRQRKDAAEDASPNAATTRSCGITSQETSGNNKPEKELVDHSKTEALVEKIDRKLTTTLHGSDGSDGSDGSGFGAIVRWSM